MQPELNGIPCDSVRFRNRSETIVIAFTLHTIPVRNSGNRLQPELNGIPCASVRFRPVPESLRHYSYRIQIACNSVAEFRESVAAGIEWNCVRFRPVPESLLGFVMAFTLRAIPVRNSGNRLQPELYGIPCASVRFRPVPESLRHYSYRIQIACNSVPEFRESVAAGIEWNCVRFRPVPESLLGFVMAFTLRAIPQRNSGNRLQPELYGIPCASVRFRPVPESLRHYSYRIQIACNSVPEFRESVAAGIERNTVGFRPIPESLRDDSYRMQIVCNSVAEFGVLVAAGIERNSARFRPIPESFIRDAYGISIACNSGPEFQESDMNCLVVFDLVCIGTVVCRAIVCSWVQLRCKLLLSATLSFCNDQSVNCRLRGLVERISALWLVMFKGRKNRRVPVGQKVG